MTEKIMIDGVDVSECEYWVPGGLGYCRIGLWANDGTHICECEPNCYYKQLARKTEECEKLKEKLNPKLKNAHCAYFEGQTGLCRAKEFKRCNPVNCNLYTIDELSTILDLQQQLQAEKQKVKELQAENEELKKELINSSGTLTDKIRAEVFTDLQKENDRYKQALGEIKEHVDKKCLKCRNSTLDDEYCAEEKCSLWEILQICEVLNEL